MHGEQYVRKRGTRRPTFNNFHRIIVGEKARPARGGVPVAVIGFGVGRGYDDDSRFHR